MYIRHIEMLKKQKLIKEFSLKSRNVKYSLECLCNQGTNGPEVSGSPHKHYLYISICITEGGL